MLTLRTIAVSVNGNLTRGSDKMSSVNKVILIGNLGQDPDLKFSSTGTAICKLSIATSQKRKDQSGQYQDETQWHRVTLFGKQAEVCGEYLAKGKKVYIEGRIQYDKYTDKDGVTKYTTDIIANDMRFMENKNDKAPF